MSKITPISQEILKTPFVPAGSPKENNTLLLSIFEHGLKENVFFLQKQLQITKYAYFQTLAISKTTQKKNKLICNQILMKHLRLRLMFDVNFSN